jgi:hypothetical protein
MAITIDFSDWDAAGVVPQSKTIQAALNSRLQIGVATVTIGASDNYVTGGISADLTDNNRFKTVIGALALSYNSAVDMSDFNLSYDVANKKILVFGELSDDAAGVTTDAGALPELANADTATNSKVLKFLVIGYA